MPRPPLPADRLVVCDCLTLFVAMVGPNTGAAATLVALFLGDDPDGPHGVTTATELQRARRIVRDHARKRAEKFPPRALRHAERQLDVLESGALEQFAVAPHPTVTAIAGDERDDHLLVLSAAVAWGAGHFSTYNGDLRRMKTFAGINIGTPDQILKRLQR